MTNRLICYHYKTQRQITIEKAVAANIRYDIVLLKIKYKSLFLYNQKLRYYLLRNDILVLDKSGLECSSKYNYV